MTGVQTCALPILDIIGQAGKTIKEIIEKFDVAIDLDREKGEVKISFIKSIEADATPSSDRIRSSIFPAQTGQVNPPKT